VVQYELFRKKSKVIYGVLANSTEADLETTDHEKSRSSPSDNFISVPLRKHSILVLGGYHPFQPQTLSTSIFKLTQQSM